MIIFDAHLDLAWNALDWNRNLQLRCAAIRQIEKDAGDTEKDAAAGLVEWERNYRCPALSVAAGAA